MDGVTHIKHTGCYGPKSLELLHKPGVTDNNGIGRTVKMADDNRNDLVRIDMNINHISKGHIGSDSRVLAVSRQAKHGYNYRKLNHKWKEHLPLGRKSGDIRQDL